MKKVTTRLSILFASFAGIAMLGLGGTASASSVNVSTRGPNSPVYVQSSGGGCGNWCGNNDWNNDWNNNHWDHEQSSNDWNCRGRQSDWGHKKKKRCGNWNNNCTKTWDWCKSSCNSDRW